MFMIKEDFLTECLYAVDRLQHGKNDKPTFYDRNSLTQSERLNEFTESLLRLLHISFII